MAISIQIRGFDQLLATFDNLEEALVVDIDNACRAKVYDINADASTFIQGAALDNGELLQSQQVIEDPHNRSYSAVNTAPYAGYVHFGTGQKVEIPQGWQDVAAEWKGKKGGTFSEFVQRMREWLGRHGGNPDKAYIVCVSILTNGLEARPFLSVPFQKGVSELTKEVNDIVKSALRS